MRKRFGNNLAGRRLYSFGLPHLTLEFVAMKCEQVQMILAGLENRFQLMKINNQNGQNGIELAQLIKEVQQLAMKLPFNDPGVNQLISQMNSFSESCKNEIPDHNSRRAGKSQYF
ncbi:hypothetical protein A1359_13740 [Methylomonas lenta]|uniref:Uncharacterized protein n=1 Tax=Methylomonas lenta TaxID=980561 RepID=A0A177N4R2_9GAMM|nr:hypothetical protein A1359_13740 [Methylomonas lenta]